MIARDNLTNVHLPEDGFGDYPHTAVAQGGAEPAGRTYSFHTHHRAQLFQIVRGSLRLETERGYFIVPPERAVFVPSGVLHEVTYLQETERSYLFFRPDGVVNLPSQVSVIGTTPLLRELILAFLEIPRADAGSARAERLVAVILDQLETSPAAPLSLPSPGSERLRSIASDIRNEPGADWPLDELASRAAMSPRSFQRHFQSETGMSFRAWRQQAKLLKAVEWLAVGQSVSDIAFSLGYSGPSAFIAVFRTAFGVSPGQYFQETFPGHCAGSSARLAQ
ncbi:helix-turn-helix transcriptional regulator [Rhizobium lentis]|uniref:AraC-like DNA-binding protein n=1 Tax=Rhizobium lentis TaxID=1138194 RepID=A0A7W8XKL0_9HYPH|nr:helix-turn-helix transcriptional regulator [Rhizobium lentis]MBB4577418.1 AraC-like DNA-binding protein [Rhizobium lentis]MBB5554033.1 AraC-like DNA-binding protein [Rhizobium lentis]MBB5564607.1 AraC-like DNA-binding protein [Rhizobium lentis]MBB5571145.1 AraC-like DNA-binding protein [Rhizobium lentis]